VETKPVPYLFRQDHSASHFQRHPIQHAIAVYALRGHGKALTGRINISVNFRLFAASNLLPVPKNRALIDTHALLIQLL
jgi:hypothetical protein